MAIAPDSFEDDDGGVRQWLPLVIGALLLVAFGYWIYMQATAVKGVKVDAPPPAILNMLPPPPPPPPPPPKPIPEPPKPTDAPNPMPNPEPPKAPAAPAPMQMNAAPQAGTDAFGMPAGSSPGSGAPGSPGTCITPGKCATGPGGPVGGIGEAFYTRYLAGAIQERVLDNSKVNRLAFQAGFAITIENGRVTAARLVRSSGKPDLDAQLKAILEATSGLTAPPAGWNGRPREITVRGRRPV